jgi:hypothetical protein
MVFLDKFSKLAHPDVLNFLHQLFWKINWFTSSLKATAETPLFHQGCGLAMTCNDVVMYFE